MHVTPPSARCGRAKPHISPASVVAAAKEGVSDGRGWGNVRLQPGSMSLRPRWATTIERAVGARLQVGENVVDVGSDVRIVGEAFHHRRPAARAVANDPPEGFEIGQSIDQGGTERRTQAVLPMAVIAARMIAAKAVVGLRIDLAVDDAIELAAARVILRGGAARNRNAARETHREREPRSDDMHQRLSAAVPLGVTSTLPPRR